MFWRGTPVFDWLQVEVTSHCNASCLYCPRTVHRDRWLNRHLSLDTFEKLLPVFKAHGWLSCRAGANPFSTRTFSPWPPWPGRRGAPSAPPPTGCSLTRRKSPALVDVGLDVVAFSLAGTSAKNDFWRRGTRMAAVLGAIRDLAAAKARRRASRPGIHVAYMLLRLGLEGRSCAGAGYPNRAPPVPN